MPVSSNKSIIGPGKSGSNTAPQILLIDNLHLLGKALMTGLNMAESQNIGRDRIIDFCVQDNRNFEIGPAIQYKECNPV